MVKYRLNLILLKKILDSPTTISYKTDSSLSLVRYLSSRKCQKLIWIKIASCSEIDRPLLISSRVNPNFCARLINLIRSTLSIGYKNSL